MFVLLKNQTSNWICISKVWSTLLKPNAKQTSSRSYGKSGSSEMSSQHLWVINSKISPPSFFWSHQILWKVFVHLRLQSKEDPTFPILRAGVTLRSRRLFSKGFQKKQKFTQDEPLLDIKWSSPFKWPKHNGFFTQMFVHPQCKWSFPLHPTFTETTACIQREIAAWKVISKGKLPVRSSGG